MNRVVHRRRALQAGLAMGASLVLPAARACEFDAATLRVIHPWARATPPGATFAVVCMRFDQVTEADRLVFVASPVAAGAEMGGPGAGPGVDVLIPQGRETSLGETPTHLRLIGLKFPLEAGRSYPLTLGFEKGGIVNADLSIDFA